MDTANKRDYDAPIDWLKASGMILQVVSLEAPLSPLRGYAKDSIFKLYLSDTGMLSALSGIRPIDLLADQDNMYKGAIAENYVIQQMAVHINLNSRVYFVTTIDPLAATEWYPMGSTDPFAV